jgi:hypothetical protein
MPVAETGALKVNIEPTQARPENILNIENFLLMQADQSVRWILTAKMP